MRFILIIFLFTCSAAYTQEIKFLPIQFFQFSQNFAFINPASNTNAYKYDVSVGHRGNAGEFSNNYISYFNGQLKFYQSLKRYNSLGINAISYHDGQFIRKNQLQLNYAWHTPLRENMSIGAGISLGFMNYGVLSTPLTNGASAMAPDGNIGLWLYGVDYYLGASINQFYNSKLRPFNEVTRMTRHYNIVAGKEFKLNSDVKIRSNILWRTVPDFPDNFNIALNTVLKDLLFIGCTYQYRNGISLTGGLENIRVSESRFRFLFSFQFYTPRKTLNLQSYEIGLAYFLHKGMKQAVSAEINLEE